MRTVLEALVVYERDEHCRVCSGVLIGTEKQYGTCGHCGGRSVRPKRRMENARGADRR